MNRHQIAVFPGESALAKAAADAFAECAREAVDHRGLFSVMLSGGRTPMAMFQRLASPELRGQVPWQKTQVFWGDERMVPADHPDSNYGSARDALLKHVPIPPGQIHRVRTELGGPEAVADDYRRQLGDFAPRGGRRFDLVLLGMGEDGHTASLFPGVPIPSDSGQGVIAPWVPRLKSYRVSVLPELINSSRQVSFLVCGAEKALTLKAVLEGPFDPARYPVQRIHPEEGKLLWMIDTQAASLLDIRR